MPLLNSDVIHTLSPYVPLDSKAPSDEPDQWHHDFVKAAKLAGFRPKQAAFMWQWLARFVVPAA